MAVRVCSCGFANREDAEACLACGTPLDGLPNSEASADDDLEACGEGPMLVLSQASGGNEVIEVLAPGGIIGRAGAFSPEAFSERVSGVHANLEFSGSSWTIEHLGRNQSAILRAGERIELPKGRPIGLLDGDQLLLADMLFRVAVRSGQNRQDEDAAPCSDVNEAAGDGRWVVVCPACGNRYEVDDESGRISECETCADALDRRKIVSVRARLEAPSA